MSDFDKNLWCVNIQGPDDIVATADYVTATKVANAFNTWWGELKAKKPLHQYDPRMWAIPIVWSGSAELHAESVANPSTEYAIFFPPKEFEPCISINHELGITEATFEDVAYIAKPVFEGIHHWLDKHVAMDDGRLVGITFWGTTPPKASVPGLADFDISPESWWVQEITDYAAGATPTIETRRAAKMACNLVAAISKSKSPDSSGPTQPDHSAHDATAHEICPDCHGTGQPNGIKGGPEHGLCSFCSGSGHVGRIFGKLSPDPRPVIRDNPDATLAFLSTAELVNQAAPTDGVWVNPAPYASPVRSAPASFKTTISSPPAFDKDRMQLLATELAAAHRVIGDTHRPTVHENCQDERCVICVGGLFVCRDCGAAEIEAVERVCTGPAAIALLIERLERAGRVLTALPGDHYAQVEPCSDAIAAIRAHPERIGAAAKDVLAERRRQVEVEGWVPEHHDAHGNGDIARAAGVYALNAAGVSDRATSHLNWWPWSLNWWKPTNPRRDLVKAGALIIAEIERLDRLAQSGGSK